jgi:hypothetical protein
MGAGRTNTRQPSVLVVLLILVAWLANVIMNGVQLFLIPQPFNHSRIVFAGKSDPAEKRYADIAALTKIVDDTLRTAAITASMENHLGIQP